MNDCKGCEEARKEIADLTRRVMRLLKGTDPELKRLREENERLKRALSVSKKMRLEVARAIGFIPASKPMSEQEMISKGIDPKGPLACLFIGPVREKARVG